MHLPGTLIRALTQTLLLTCAALPLAAGDDGARDAHTFPYDDWATVLDHFVDADGLVDYRGLAADRAALDRFVAQVETVSPQSHPERFPSRDDRLAYYLNAYNALIFAGVLDVLDGGPDVASVWGRSKTGIGFFLRRKVTVGGRKTSLKKLEDDQIRAGFEDPRIHAALNCASISCPRLPRVPFHPMTLDAELDAAMREFVADPRHVTVDAQAGTVFLSKIFDWFEKDFIAFERGQGNTMPSLIGYLNRYRARDALIPASSRVRFTRYDKGLNRQP